MFVCYELGLETIETKKLLKYLFTEIVNLFFSAGGWSSTQALTVELVG